MNRYTIEGLPSFCSDIAGLEFEIDTDQSIYDIFEAIAECYREEFDDRMLFTIRRTPYGIRVEFEVRREHETLKSEVWFIGIDENASQIIFSGQDKPPIPHASYHVSVYLDDRAYGGREEGGWWYDTRQLEKTFEVYTWGEAVALKRELEGVEYSNEGRRDISSVLSNGRYHVTIEPEPGMDEYPQEKPQYC